MRISIGGIFAREQILEKDFYNYSYFYVKVKEGVENIDYYVRPEGLYAVGYEIGGDIEDAYSRIIEFIKKMECKLAKMHMRNICWMRW